MVFQRHLDCSNDSVDVVHHLMIPKADDSVAQGSKIFSSFGIIRFLFQVLAAVQLDDEFLLDAAEIGDIFANGMLPSKIHAQLVSAKVCPQF